VRPIGIVSLPVPDHDDAVVSFPSAAAELAPLVFVAHGAKDLPSAQCELLRAVLGDRGTIVCLAGPRADVREEPRYFPDHPTLEKILLATSAAFRGAYPDRAPDARTLYVGYSQGATMGALVIASHGSEFRELLLIEGGFTEWTAARAAEFVKAGGRSVAFVCGTKRCAEDAPTSARILRKAGAATTVISSSGGHVYGPLLREGIARAIRFLDDGSSTTRKTPM
jgi:pimeloyl-ACP methyl ester carboxylesterase